MPLWRTSCTIAIVIALLATLIPHADAARSMPLRLDAQALTRVLLADLAEAISACHDVPMTACAHIQRHFAADVQVASLTGVIEYTLLQQLLAFVASAAAGLSAAAIATIVAAIVLAVVILWCISDTKQCQKIGHTLHKQALSLLERSQLGRHTNTIKIQASQKILKTWNELYSAFKKNKNVRAFQDEATKFLHSSFEKLPPSFHKKMVHFCNILPLKIRSEICIDRSTGSDRIIHYPTRKNQGERAMSIQGATITSSALKHIPDEQCLQLLLFGKRADFTDPNDPQHENMLHMRSITFAPYATLTAVYKWFEPNYVPKDLSEASEIKSFAHTAIMVYQLKKPIQCTIINDMHQNGRIKHDTIDQQKTPVKLNGKTFLIILYDVNKNKIFHAHFRNDGRIEADVQYLRYTRYANMQIFPEKKDDPIYRYSNRKTRPEEINSIAASYRYQIPLHAIQNKPIPRQ